MSESDTYKIIEIAGTSPDGVTEAMRSGVERASKTVRGLDWVEVRTIRGHIQNDDGGDARVEGERRRRCDRLAPRAIAWAAAAWSRT